MELEKDRKKLIEIYQEEIKRNEKFTQANVDKLDIYEGNLLPYVLNVMEATLSKNYFDKIKERVIPINVLTRIVDKLSKVYINSPARGAQDKNKGDSELMAEMAEEMGLNIAMGLADEYSHLFKGYALEPFMDEGKAQLRVLPYDRFLVVARDRKNPMKMTDFIKFMGEVSNGQGGTNRLYFAYTADQFIPFTSDGEEHFPSLEGNDGLNPIGRIPFVYGNRSRQHIIPTIDSDITQMTKMIPILLSDLAGAIMFQCFSIIYGIDIQADNMVMAPNAFWNFKSDAKSDNQPSIGTVKPEADVDKVLNFIKQVLAFWLETKGVRIGSLNSMDAGNVSSGISKIIDEMDVFEVKKKQIVCFTKEEKDLWLLMKEMNKYWVQIHPEYNRSLFTDAFQPSIVFDEPSPEVSRHEKVTQITTEISAGLMDRATGIKELNPDLGEEELKQRFLAVGLDENGLEPEPEIPEESDEDEESNIDDKSDDKKSDKSNKKGKFPFKK